MYEYNIDVINVTIITNTHHPRLPKNITTTTIPSQGGIGSNLKVGSHLGRTAWATLRWEMNPTLLNPSSSGRDPSTTFFLGTNGTAALTTVSTQNQHLQVHIQTYETVVVKYESLSLSGSGMKPYW